MTTYVSPLSNNASELARRYIKPNDRVLITGASGWFGRTSTLLFQSLKVPFYLTGSNSRTIEYFDNSFHINKWDEGDIERFQPTLVVDCAYLTREFAKSVTLDEYSDINRELLNRIIKISKLPSIRKIISFSSGAADPYASGLATNGITEDPYGYLKHEAELRLTNEIDTVNSKISIPRVWSVSGALVTKIRGFAFSDLIFQARSGEIIISSNQKVVRRYCAIEEVIAVAMADASDLHPIFNTGGDSIEIRDLAQRVSAIVEPTAKIMQSDPISSEINNYQSSNLDWTSRCGALDFDPMTIDEQISLVSSWM